MYKKFVFLSILALAVMFSACEQEADLLEVAGIEVFDSSIKGFAKLDGDDEGADYAFVWTFITADEFADGQTPPFNNWEKPLGEGIVVYRTKPSDNGFMENWQSTPDFLAFLNGKNKQDFGNGNDPVYIWFDAVEIEKQLLAKEIGLDAEIIVLVKYKSSNNVAFTFNLVKAAEYCAANGPISLGEETIGMNVGDVTQVRLQPVEVGNPGGELTIKVVDKDLEEKDSFGETSVYGCPLLTTDLIDAFYADVEDLEAYFGLAKNQKIVGWKVLEPENVNFDDKVCGSVTVQPLVETTQKVNVYVMVGFNLTCDVVEKTSIGDGNNPKCPVIPVGYLDSYEAPEGFKIVGWLMNGLPFDLKDLPYVTCKDVKFTALLAMFKCVIIDEDSVRGKCISGIKFFTCNVFEVAFSLKAVYVFGNEFFYEPAGNYLFALGGSKKSSAIFANYGYAQFTPSENFEGCGTWDEDFVFKVDKLFNLTFAARVQDNELVKFAIVR